MTILIVIVMLGSIVFQQTTGALQTGQRKVDSQVVLRNVIGAISRDLAQAVDSSDYKGLENTTSIASGNSITFLALTGTPGEKLDGGSDPKIRTAQIVSYSYESGIVRRKVQSTTCSGGNWSGTGTAVQKPLNDSPLSTFEFKVPDDSVPAGTVPDRVSVLAGIETVGRTVSIGVGSGGKNMQFETDDKDSDDIYVGYNPNTGD